MRGLPQIPRGRDEITQCAKDAGGAWKQMTELEKQPFFEESKAAFAQYSKDRSEYVANVDSSVLKRVNARRIKLGKPRVRSSAGAARIGPFTLFLKENALSVRESFAGQGLSSKELISATGKEASVRWKALSETEQEDYRKRAAELRAAANAAA
ncbi:hypothetical protein NEOLEDRAFT_719650 [Neolentinus lepideus HHB14362 ss-1]|uniref:HMG box domain-containing protein n=1 Tax=Neolentinus lepideus HHB14362 ss-1 TaxID=1314782 RepID=A0A165Q5X7_9AGAM|nr:hypothetical protein NEOLEDRAFT_719650 [Neolentinus lepideus HHB14362 ss-1]